MKKKQIRLTESQLRQLVKESVQTVLKETDLYADDPYFYDDYLAPEDPRSDYPEGKEGDVDYDWYCNFDRGADSNFDRKSAETNLAFRNSDWSPREVRLGQKNMNAWVNGKIGKDADENEFHNLEDSWDEHRI